MTDSVLDLLPPAFRYRRVEIPPEQNAFEPLAQAIAGLVGEASDYPSQWPPDADDRECGCTRSVEEIRELLFEAKNEASLDQVEAAVAKGVFQYPDYTGIGFKDFASVLSFEQMTLLGRLHRLRGKILAAEGNVAQAVVEIERLLIVADRSMHGQGLVTHALINFGCVQQSMFACRSLFDYPLAPADAHRLLATVLACRRPSAGFRESTVIEVNWELVRLAATYPAGASTDQLFDIVVDEHFPQSVAGSESENNEYAWKPDVLADRRKQCRDALIQLLDQHPRPFDRQDYLRRWVERTIGQAKGIDEPQWPFTNQRSRLDRFMRRMLAPLQRRRYERQRIWPFVAFPSPLNMHGEEIDDEIFDSINNGTPIPLLRVTPENLEQCKANLWKCENPLGQLLVRGQSLTPCDFLARLGDGAMALTKAVAALGTFQIDHGWLPRRLDEIISAGILRALPIDPYSGRPLRYDADFGLVWSVGEREDCAIASRGDPPWRRRMVWQMKSAQGRAPSRRQAWWRRLPPPDRGWDDSAGSCSVDDDASSATTAQTDAKSDST